MSQMNSSEEQYSYGQYEGNPSYTRPANDTYDDNFIEALAQRIAQRVPQSSQGKIVAGSKHSAVSAGQRLALAIVSLCLLIPLAAILMNSLGGILGVVAFGMACAVIFLVNAIFSAMH